ncbi:MAG: ATP-binding protein [Pseudomonadales bacterium]|nr:ATP-binding protein [Pseudomonadales bacterium]
MDDYHSTGSVVIISQLATEQWFEMIGDYRLVDAILDRIMHSAHRMKLQGESMRKKLNSLTHGEHLS